MRFCAWFIILLVLITIVVTTILLVIILHDSENENENEVENDELFELSIVHFNDFHARFEEINENSLPCRVGEKCIGGLPRMKTIVDKLMKRKNAILLNAGDSFQGTFWYSLLRYRVTAHFLNFLPVDAMVLGNHEFAHRVGGLVPFLKLLNTTVVTANIDDNLEPEIQGLYEKSIVIEKSGRKIGIIGAIFRETADVAITDGIKFLDEAKSIRNEATKLRRQGVNIIIVLSHCGVERDREIALETGDFVDVIVGGHSHSFLYTSEDGKWPGPVKPEEEYPIVVTPKSGRDRKVLIVQASAFTKFVGFLTVYFNSEGHVKFYDGNPVFVGENVEKDEKIEKELIPWRKEVEELSNRVVGFTKTGLINENCRNGECALGSFCADAFVLETQKAFPELQVFASFIPAAGIRSSFPSGNITYGDIVALMPFENTVDIFELSGKTLLEVFEHSVSRSFSQETFIGIHMLQVSGFQVTFNTTKSVGKRVQSLKIRTKLPEDYQNINPHMQYRVMTTTFIANGGDGFTMIKSNRKNYRIGLLDIDIMEKFIERISPISFEADGRILMLT